MTEAWSPPPPPEEDEGEGPVDRQREWETRQELRQLGLLRERPLLTYDGRTELYWGQVREAREEADRAIVDPYTELVVTFADADIDGIPAHRVEAREYGRAGEALLEVGRAYVAIGRNKSAQGVFRAAAKADPLHPKIWWHLGVSHLFARSNQAAAKALRRSLDQAPGDFLTELALGVARYHAKDYPAAEDCFRRLAGGAGLRATARSMLVCSMRMQRKWDDARVELSFLREAQPGDWEALAVQCLDCVGRGEQKRTGPLRARRRAKRMWQSLATAAAGAIWIAYAVSQDLFREQSRWVTLPLFLLVVILARTLRGISGGELPGEFGNAEQGLPCWQETPWMRHRKSEF
ncbi:MAG: tetratricopeptide repeat protein [Armatimonadota bacterium]|nr:MAG: tetratricopeptide repeat protein [Armatimonadota bacterium]